MSESALQGIRACVFDAYGTLFDYASAAAGCRDVLGDKLGPLVALWREKQLQYAWLRSLQGAHADFWQVTGDGLDFALEALGIASPELRTRLMNLYLALELFPEVPEMLKRVKAAGLKTAMLSNGSPAMLAAAIEHAKIGPYLDSVLSIEDAGIYKPHPKAYQVAVDRLGEPASALVFLSSNGWDAYGAARFGMRVVWCNRYGQGPERLPGKPDREIKTLAELPALLGA
jgi:2-haloacid dehalogenase